MLTWTALILVTIGALNWGLVGLFNLDIVEGLFRGRRSPVGRLAYSLIGLSGLYILVLIFMRR